MCSNDEGIGSQMSSSVRHLERMMEQLLHCTPDFYTSVKFKTVTAKSSGVVSSVAQEVNQPLVRWKCNFFHFQEEQSGRDHFNNFLRLLCYNIRDLFLLCYSFPSQLQDKTTGTPPNPLSRPTYFNPINYDGSKIGQTKASICCQ